MRYDDSVVSCSFFCSLLFSSFNETVKLAFSAALFLNASTSCWVSSSLFCIICRSLWRFDKSVAILAFSSVDTANFPSNLSIDDSFNLISLSCSSIFSFNCDICFSFLVSFLVMSFIASSYDSFDFVIDESFSANTRFSSRSEFISSVNLSLVSCIDADISCSCSCSLSFSSFSDSAKSDFSFAFCINELILSCDFSDSSFNVWSSSQRSDICLLKLASFSVNIETVFLREAFSDCILFRLSNLMFSSSIRLFCLFNFSRRISFSVELSHWVLVNVSFSYFKALTCSCSFSTKFCKEFEVFILSKSCLFIALFSYFRLSLCSCISSSKESSFLHFSIYSVSLLFFDFITSSNRWHSSFILWYFATEDDKSLLQDSYSSNSEDSSSDNALVSCFRSIFWFLSLSSCDWARLESSFNLSCNNTFSLSIFSMYSFFNESCFVKCSSLVERFLSCCSILSSLTSSFWFASWKKTIFLLSSCNFFVKPIRSESFFVFVSVESIIICLISFFNSSFSEFNSMILFSAWCRFSWRIKISLSILVCSDKFSLINDALSLSKLDSRIFRSCRDACNKLILDSVVVDMCRSCFWNSCTWIISFWSNLISVCFIAVFNFFSNSSFSKFCWKIFLSACWRLCSSFKVSLSTFIICVFNAWFSWIKDAFSRCKRSSFCTLSSKFSTSDLEFLRCLSSDISFINFCSFFSRSINFDLYDRQFFVKLFIFSSLFLKILRTSPFISFSYFVRCSFKSATSEDKILFASAMFCIFDLNVSIWISCSSIFFLNWSFSCTSSPCKRMYSSASFWYLAIIFFTSNLPSSLAASSIIDMIWPFSKLSTLFCISPFFRVSKFFSMESFSFSAFKSLILSFKLLISSGFWICESSELSMSARFEIHLVFSLDEETEMHSLVVS